MKKAYCVLFSALLMVACGDDNSSSANDNELSSSSEETSIESSTDEEIVSSSSEKKEEQNSSSSVHEASSSSDKGESSSSVQEVSSSSTENEQSSSSSNNQAIPDFGDNKIVIKLVPTFGELDGKPYFYTTEPRCTYKNNVFSIKADTSDNAYFYEIANDTLTLYHVDLDKVLAGSYEEPSAKETYYGKNTNLESEWERLCYYNLNDDYTSCTQKYSYLISRDTIYNSLTYPIDYNYQIFKFIEKVSHSRLGIYDEMSAAQRATKYAENGISIDSTGTKTLISFKDKGTLSIDEITTKIINSNETIYTKIALSTDKKECVLISETTPIKSSKYCSEEYLPYLQIDDFDGYVSSYAKGNQKEFNACLESLFD
ncbi:hypothetical protein B7988_03600 [Fibrobacter sp. UWB1]|uniref:hypothetical protein n=1 Tax=Fibrobacter sp. UWB1 TaxID=1964355 RepID=UPI000B524ED8|nr:hypothetical protein [Fibrobacter sp. UWB1]OWV26691.1 hypothetical protein B7988_03600 [Fibrobacter sp. UWB1]